MCGAGLIGGTTGTKLFFGELADRLQHRKPGSGPAYGSATCKGGPLGGVARAWEVGLLGLNLLDVFP